MLGVIVIKMQKIVRGHLGRRWFKKAKQAIVFLEAERLFFFCLAERADGERRGSVKSDLKVTFAAETFPMPPPDSI